MQARTEKSMINIIFGILVAIWLFGSFIVFWDANRLGKVFPSASRKLKIASVIFFVAAWTWGLIFLWLFVINYRPQMNVAVEIGVTCISAFATALISSSFITFYNFKERIAQWRKEK